MAESREEARAERERREFIEESESEAAAYLENEAFMWQRLGQRYDTDPAAGADARRRAEQYRTGASAVRLLRDEITRRVRDARDAACYRALRDALPVIESEEGDSSVGVQGETTLTFAVPAKPGTFSALGDLADYLRGEVRA
ncbi:MAG: hypothetical protein ACYC0B_02230 [Gemmatimonadaceae bacterium]